VQKTYQCIADELPYYRVLSGTVTRRWHGRAAKRRNSFNSCNQKRASSLTFSHSNGSCTYHMLEYSGLCILPHGEFAGYFPVKHEPAVFLMDTNCVLCEVGTDFLYRSDDHRSSKS
jgi:hypothetical protein